MNETAKRLVMVSAAVISILTQGCAAHRRLVSVDPAYPVDLKDKQQQDMINAVKVLRADPAAQQALRNEYIDKIIITINKEFRSYKDGIYVGQSSFDTLTDFTVLALAGVTAVAGTAGTKAALGAATAGITGAHQSVAKNFFENNTRDAIFSMMDTLRQAQLAAIDQKEKLSIADYSMASAERDLDLYYEMGTILKV
jgi:hypothetical protein